MMPCSQTKRGQTVTHPVPTPDMMMSDGVTAASVGTTDSNVLAGTPTINRVVSLMPGFVYVFNHTTFSNDYTNRSVAEQLGYSSEEIRSFGAQMMMHLVHPDDHQYLAVHLTRISRLKGDDSISFEYWLIRKDGRQGWLRSVDAVFDRAPEGTVLSHIGCASDVTIE